MRIIDNEKEFKEFCNEKGIRLAYLSTNTCCACSVLKPKIEELIKKYHNAKIIVLFYNLNRKSTRLNYSHVRKSRMQSSA